MNGSFCDLASSDRVVDERHIPFIASPAKSKTPTTHHRNNMIGQVAAKSGLSKDGIRYYEKLGLIHSTPVVAGSKTYRDYDDTTLERLSIIALAKRLHFQLRELPEALVRVLSDTITREERSALIMAKVRQVDASIEGLIADRNLLAELAEEPEKHFADEKLKQLGLWIE